jgi:Flp pilus assembly protein TadG
MGRRPDSEHRASERGAILIHVGIAIIALVGITAFVADYGVLWLGRRQAQNAADAGALAGTVALAFDSYSDRTNAGPAHQSGLNAAMANTIVGTAGSVRVDQAIDATTFATTPPPTCVSAPGSCVQVDVYRDGSNDSIPLPTYFSKIWGQTSQGIRATATGQVRSANATKCVKPWMAEDLSDTSTYTMADIGTLMILRDRVGPGQYQQADFNASGGSCPCGGGCCYSWSITHCVGGPSSGGFKYSDDIENKSGRTNGKNDADEVYAQDPGATWNSSTNSIQNSCASTGTCGCTNNVAAPCANGLNGRVSPRLLAVAVFKPSDLAAIGPGGGTAPINNVVGFFLLEPGVGDPSNPNNTECVADPKNVCGYLTTIPGDLQTGGTVPATGNTLNVIVSLVR